jgi:hypothetical protein
MSEENPLIASDRHELWNERDEIQRLDFVAGVVAPTSLAGCVACAALIATGHLVHAASYVLGAVGLVLLGCAAMATISLNWSPLEAIRNDQDLEEVIDTKRSRTRTALIGLVVSVSFGFALRPWWWWWLRAAMTMLRRNAAPIPKAPAPSSSNGVPALSGCTINWQAKMKKAIIGTTKRVQ